jgi:hypothetical protein
MARMGNSGRGGRIVFVALPAALLVASVMTGLGGCRTKEWRGHEAEVRAKVLDTPFHFLLNLDGYRVDRFSNEADLFSAWGYLTLRRQETRPPVPLADARNELLRAAKRAGWRQAANEKLAVDRRTLTDLGVGAAEADANANANAFLDLTQSVGAAGKGQPTRYACRVWLVDNGAGIVIVHRVDAN